MVYPVQLGGTPPHDDLPEELKADYQEALAVANQSPRAAAALIRLILQKLMPHIGGVGKSVNQDISNLSKTFPVEVQQAMDVCRVIGNQAVHPGEIDLSDTPEIAHSLFGLINFITEVCIAQQKRAAALFNGLPEGAKQAIAKRDENPLKERSQ